MPVPQSIRRTLSRHTRHGFSRSLLHHNPHHTLICAAWPTRQPADWRRRLQVAGSILIIVATSKLVVGLLRATHADLLHTPFNSLGVQIIAAGTARST